MFEASGSKLYVLADIRVPGGKQRAALLALGDVNRNGTIEPAERQEIELHLAKRAFFGVKLWVDTSSATLDGATAKLKIPDDKTQGVELMLYGTVPLPEKRARLRVSTEKSGDPLEVHLMAGGDRRPVSASRGKLGTGVFKTTLGPLDQLSWEISSAGSGAR